MHFSDFEILELDRIQRLNIINSITGIKPGNLVGTRSMDGTNNLAIMSSAVHLGSEPAILGLIFRPQDESPRDTYLNIKQTGFYTLNHIPAQLTQQAHLTSAKFPPEVDEFQQCGFEAEFKNDFHAPYVATSPIQVALELVQEIPIELNQTILMIGKILHIHVIDEAINEQCQIDLEKSGSVGISGLDHYYHMTKIADYPYAHAPSKLN